MNEPKCKEVFEVRQSDKYRVFTDHVFIAVGKKLINENQ